MLEEAIHGKTILISAEEIGMNYDTNTGFASLSELSSWCSLFNLQYITTISGGETFYTISPGSNFQSKNCI